jgi:hypothetical protein
VRLSDYILRNVWYVAQFAAAGTFKAVAIDMSSAFTKAVRENLPGAKLEEHREGILRQSEKN